MKVQFCWVSSSIFYSTDRWPELINDCIGPLLSSLDNRSLINGYIVYFNNYRGPNLRLSVEVDRRTFSIVSNEMDQAINRYLLNYPSVVTDFSTNLFMNFANNTLRYHLYEVAPMKSNSIELVMRRAISEVLLGTSYWVTFNFESISTMLVYMQMGFIRSQFECLLQASSEISIFINKWNKTSKSASKTAQVTNTYSKLLDGNSQLLKEMYVEMWSASTEQCWLDKWIATCRGTVGHKSAFVRFNNISNMIYEHVGLTVEDQCNNSRTLLELINA